MSESAKRLLEIADRKPKVNKLLALLVRIMVNNETGHLDGYFSEGGVVDVNFKKKEI